MRAKEDILRDIREAKSDIEHSIKSEDQMRFHGDPLREINRELRYRGELRTKLGRLEEELENFDPYAYRKQQEEKANQERLEKISIAEGAASLVPIRKRNAKFQYRVSTGHCHTVLLKQNGIVFAVGHNDCRQCNVSSWRGWRDVVAIFTYGFCSGDKLCNSYTVGVKSNGTVIAAGGNKEQKKVLRKASTWQDIVAIATGYSHIGGLKSDGTVVDIRKDGKSYLSSWRNIISFFINGSYAIGLKSDGTIIITDIAVNEYKNGANHIKNISRGISDWRDIVALSSAGEDIIGLKSDGTVVTTTDLTKFRNGSAFASALSRLRNVVAIASGYRHVVCLKSDGTVTTIVFNSDSEAGYVYGNCETLKLQDIVAISAGYLHIVGLRSNGEAVSVDLGQNYYDKDKYGACNMR